ncbi:MAG: hypothetical protein IJ230_06170 [Clostridia bacterium]|nr:hypothetical protein [Clostridia bacterium]
MKPKTYSDKRIALWKSQYAQDVVFTSSSNSKLLEEFMEVYDLRVIELNLFGENTIPVLTENSGYQDNSFREFVLVKNEKSEEYYKEEEAGDEIHIIIGDNTYLYSDNNHLYLDLFINRGITEESYNNEDLFCLEYLSKFAQLDELGVSHISLRPITQPT